MQQKRVFTQVFFVSAFMDDDSSVQIVSFLVDQTLSVAEAAAHKCGQASSDSLGLVLDAMAAHVQFVYIFCPGDNSGGSEAYAQIARDARQVHTANSYYDIWQK